MEPCRPGLPNRPTAPRNRSRGFSRREEDKCRRWISIKTGMLNAARRLILSDGNGEQQKEAPSPEPSQSGPGSRLLQHQDTHDACTQADIVETWHITALRLLWVDAAGVRRCRFVNFVYMQAWVGRQPFPCSHPTPAGHAEWCLDAAWMRCNKLV